MISTNVKARPVLKWVGGKGQLLPQLLKRAPDEFGAYHEPFVGGGALFFALAAQGRIRQAYLSDINAALIDVYIAIRDDVESVIACLQPHKHDEDYYYAIRAQRPAELSLPERAARMIYLNKTCYNGLYRENCAGEFNVPFGRYKNPTICDAPNLRAAAQVLRGITIEQRQFSTVLDVARPGDWVYFDPPYDPISRTANFTAYHSHGFGEADQQNLRAVFITLADRGVRVMLSNSDTTLIRRLYQPFVVSRVYANRAVNSKAAARGRVAEVIVRSG